VLNSYCPYQINITSVLSILSYLHCSTNTEAALNFRFPRDCGANSPEVFLGMNWVIILPPILDSFS
jgi:hypothetical protein